MKRLTQEAPAAPLAQFKSSKLQLALNRSEHYPFGKFVNLGVAAHSLGKSNRVTDYFVTLSFHFFSFGDKGLNWLNFDRKSLYFMVNHIQVLKPHRLCLKHVTKASGN